jgi:hypothetical protein
MKWNKTRITKKLKALYRAGRNLAYSELARDHQPLLSAAAYHFGSYRLAVTSAGINYADVVHRPHWTRQRVIAVIKQARRSGQELHWGAVTKRRDEVGRAAFAALQPRLFGQWDRALHAAGLDADEIARYRTWDRSTVAFEFRSRAQNDDPLSSGEVQKDDPGLHSAAVRYFGSYDDALRAARLDPAKCRKRLAWTRASVIAAFRAMNRNGQHCSDSSIRKSNSALYGAAVRIFGAFTTARKAAGIKVIRKNARKK